MGVLDRRSKPEKSRDLRKYGLLTAIPGLLLAAPLIGFGIGWWLDGKFDTSPWLTVVGALMGTASAGLETYYIIKKASEDEGQSNDGTGSGT